VPEKVGFESPNGVLVEGRTQLLPTGHPTYRGSLESIFPCSGDLSPVSNPETIQKRGSGSSLAMYSKRISGPECFPIVCTPHHSARLYARNSHISLDKVRRCDLLTSASF
jgi:hypothetical protein